MRTKLLFLPFVIACILMGAVAALAAGLSVTGARLASVSKATSVCVGTTQTVPASADSWVDQGSPSANFGSDSIIKVRSKSPALNFRALVKFTLPAVPSGCSVTSAVLRLYASAAASGRTIQALRVAGSWTESAVTWSTQPGATGAPATVASATGWREWDVISQVQLMYSGSNDGFLIKDATEDSSAAPEQSFHSREKAPDKPPQLAITFG